MHMIPQSHHARICISRRGLILGDHQWYRGFHRVNTLFSTANNWTSYIFVKQENDPLKEVVDESNTVADAVPTPLALITILHFFTDMLTELARSLSERRCSVPDCTQGRMHSFHAAAFFVPGRKRCETGRFVRHKLLPALGSDGARGMECHSQSA